MSADRAHLLLEYRQRLPGMPATWPYRPPRAKVRRHSRRQKRQVRVAWRWAFEHTQLGPVLLMCLVLVPAFYRRPRRGRG